MHKPEANIGHISILESGRYLVLPNVTKWFPHFDVRDSKAWGRITAAGGIGLGVFGIAAPIFAQEPDQAEIQEIDTAICGVDDRTTPDRNPSTGELITDLWVADPDGIPIRLDASPDAPVLGTFSLGTRLAVACVKPDSENRTNWQGVISDDTGEMGWVSGKFDKIQDREVKITPKETFPEVIGDLEEDGIVIFNMGTKVGVIDNKEDPNNNWEGIVSVKRRYAPNDRFRFYFYDNPDQVPKPTNTREDEADMDYLYDTRVYWGDNIPGAGIGKYLMRKTEDGVLEYHLSIPFVENPYNRNLLNSIIAIRVLGFIERNVDFRKGPRDDDEFRAILNQHAPHPHPTYGGRTNYSLLVVYRR